MLGARYSSFLFYFTTASISDFLVRGMFITISSSFCYSLFLIPSRLGMGVWLGLFCYYIVMRVLILLCITSPVLSSFFPLLFTLLFAFSLALLRFPAVPARIRFFRLFLKHLDHLRVKRFSTKLLFHFISNASLSEVLKFTISSALLTHGACFVYDSFNFWS
jgi:hypothetical protein